MANEPRRFVIDGITMQAFEIKDGKIFVEFRGEPPKFPIYVTEEISKELPDFPVARNPSDTWKE